METARGGTRFTYLPGWTEDIACCLPATHREHDWPVGLHPFFAHLGAEGWLREQQARLAHIAEADEFGLLLRYGADCIGAVGVCPTDDSIPAPDAVEAAANAGRTISGVQKKLLAVKVGRSFVPAPATGPAPYIAKFNTARLTTLVRNEALSLRWLSAVLGANEVTRFETSRIEALGEVALIVTRFDRKPDGEKLRMEDCAQILAKPQGRTQQGKYEASYEDVANVIRQHSVRPTIDLLRFLRRLIAFTILGNCDAHLKNFSLLETPAGLRLSPAYDVINTALYLEFDQNLALTIDGRVVALDTADGALFRRFGHIIGLPQKAIDQAFADVRRGVAKAATILPTAEAGHDEFGARYTQIVSDACLRILAD
jgi:serine/threonine-protein kinase HipA